jgi:DNA-directed RNA polymerase alpha subunit
MNIIAETKDALATSVDELKISTRALNCLKRSGVQTVGELVQYSAKDLMRWRNMGSGTVGELDLMLRVHYRLTLRDDDSRLLYSIKRLAPGLTSEERAHLIAWLSAHTQEEE